MEHKNTWQEAQPLVTQAANLPIPKDLEKLHEQLPDGYFTPSIEDVRMGYEFEVKITNPNHSQFDQWMPYRVGDDYDELKIGRVVELLSSGVEIRVPYLTVEQIEKEGWKITSREQKSPPYQVDWINAQRGKSPKEYKLWINLALHKYMTMGIESHIYKLYHGRCRDINEFRQIMKLLKIQ